MALAAMALCAAAQEPVDNRIFAPPAGARFPAGASVRVIARMAPGAEMKLDGVPLSMESPHPGVATLELKLTPGAHTFQLGDQSIRVVAGDGVDEGKPFRAHPPVSNCGACHTVRNGRWRFLRASLSNVCSQCHAKETFPARHTHAMDVLPDCQMCHDPHGSTAAAHLKMDRDAACRQCHSLQPRAP